MSVISDNEWRARDDARSLAEAEEIKQDTARLQKAQAAAKKMLDEKKDEIAGLRKAAGKSPKNNQSAKRKQKLSNATKGGKHKAPTTNNFNVFKRI
jgi:hypothetical protein